MASQEWIDAHDIQYDLLKPNAFRLAFHNLPKVSYFCQTCNFPGLSASGNPELPTKLMNIPLSFDKLIKDDLTITFLIDAELKNYMELYNWIRGIGFPNSNEEFIAWRADGKNKRYVQNHTPLNEESGLYADATLTLLSPLNNPQISIRFKDIFPVSISGLPFDSAISDINYFTATSTFKYQTFEIEVL